MSIVPEDNNMSFKNQQNLAFIQAIDEKNPMFAEALVETGAPFKIKALRDTKEFYHYQQAYYNKLQTCGFLGYTSIIEKLLTTKNYANKYVYSALLGAVFGSQENTAYSILKNHFVPRKMNVNEHYGQILNHSIAKRLSNDFIDYLFSIGANLTSASKPPLLLAAKLSHVDVLKNIFEKTIDHYNTHADKNNEKQLLSLFKSALRLVCSRQDSDASQCFDYLYQSINQYWTHTNPHHLDYVVLQKKLRSKAPDAIQYGNQLFKKDPVFLETIKNIGATHPEFQQFLKQAQFYDKLDASLEHKIISVRQTKI